MPIYTRLPVAVIQTMESIICGIEGKTLTPTVAIAVATQMMDFHLGHLRYVDPSSFTAIDMLRGK